MIISWKHRRPLFSNVDVGQDDAVAVLNSLTLTLYFCSFSKWWSWKALRPLMKKKKKRGRSWAVLLGPGWWSGYFPPPPLHYFLIRNTIIENTYRVFCPWIWKHWQTVTGSKDRPGFSWPWCFVTTWQYPMMVGTTSCSSSQKLTPCNIYHLSQLLLAHAH